MSDTLEQAFEKAVTLPLRFLPGDVDNHAVIENGDGVVIFVEGDAPDEEREATAALMVHCTNTYMTLVAALQKVLDWRDGPEGPAVLFGMGTQMMKHVREALATAHLVRRNRDPQTG